MRLYTCVCVCVCILVHRLWVSVSVLQSVDGVMHAHVYSCAYVCVCICVKVYIYVHFFAVSVAYTLEQKNFLSPRARQCRKVSAKTMKSSSSTIFAKPTHNDLETRRSLRSGSSRKGTSRILKQRTRRVARRSRRSLIRSKESEKGTRASRTRQRLKKTTRKPTSTNKTLPGR